MFDSFDTMLQAAYESGYTIEKIIPTRLCPQGMLHVCVTEDPHVRVALMSIRDHQALLSFVRSMAKTYDSYAGIVKRISPDSQREGYYIGSWAGVPFVPPGKDAEEEAAKVYLYAFQSGAEKVIVNV